MADNIFKNIQLICSGLLTVIGGFFIIAPIFHILMALFITKYFYDKATSVQIKWAPFQIPIKRRLQVLAISYYIAHAFLFVPAFLSFNYILLYYFDNFGRTALILYWIYTYYDHHKSLSITNGLGFMALRRSIIGRYARAYFPVELVKTAELRPDRHYILACFPHGILVFGPLMNMIVDIEIWFKLFPGIRPKVGTLNINFCLPFLRHYLRAFGFVSIAKESLLYYLCKSNDPQHLDNQDGFTSNAIMISVGGAKEACEYRLGENTITLKDRKGFIRIAIMSGASIVPSFTFNEVEIYEQVVPRPGSVLYYFQHFSKKIFGVWLPIIIGRGLFQYSVGLLPQRRRLVQVVGAPIEVKQCDTPDPDYIDELHQKFIKALTELFDNHKDKYLIRKGANLVIT